MNGNQFVIPQRNEYLHGITNILLRIDSLIFSYTGLHFSQMTFQSKCLSTIHGPIQRIQCIYKVKFFSPHFQDIYDKYFPPENLFLFQLSYNKKILLQKLFFVSKKYIKITVIKLQILILIRQMQLPKDYPYALTVALGMSLQLYLEGFAVSRVRKAVFNEEFMRKQFGETHRREIGTEIFLGGCPDTGSGLYSKRLSYKDWYKYNVAQRIHLNYVEGINFGQISLLSAALYRPKQAALVGLLYIVGRFVFKYSYKKYGPGSSGRIVGIVLFLLSVAINSGIFLTNFIKSIK